MENYFSPFKEKMHKAMNFGFWKNLILIFTKTLLVIFKNLIQMQWKLNFCGHFEKNTVGMINILYLIYRDHT